jgi:hypothetical protein
MARSGRDASVSGGRQCIAAIQPSRTSRRSCPSTGYLRDAKIEDVEAATVQALADCLNEYVADVNTGMESLPSG